MSPADTESTASTSTGLRVQLGWAAGLLLVAALGLGAGYRGAAAPLVLAAAVLLPLALLWLAARLGRGTIGPALALVAAGAVLAWLVLRADGQALGDALPRLLTSARPVAATSSLLVPPVLLTYLVAVVAGAFVLAPGGSGDRVRGALAPALGAAALYTAAQLLTAGGADRHGVSAISLLVVIAAGWSAPVRRGTLRVAWRPAGVLPVVVAAGLAAGAAGLVSGPAFDPRRHVTPPTVRLVEPSPLGQLASWAAHPDAVVLQARLSGTARLRLATMADFTGAAWQVADRYRPLGLLGAPALAPGGRTTPVRAAVRIVQLGGVWLPAAGRPVSADHDGLLADPDSGTVAAPGQVRPGLQYVVRGRQDAPTPGQLAAASVPQQLPNWYVALPSVPAGFGQYARAAVRGASTPLEEAVALEHAVTTGRRLVPTAPTGSSYGRLQTFLFGPAGTAGAQQGSDEQFAAAFAVLGRAVGLPTRLAVGFVVDGRGTVTVRGRDATVWPEVYFAHLGWVPFAPSPDETAAGAEQGLRESVLRRVAQRAQQLPPATPVAPGQAHGRPPGTRTAAATGGRSPWWTVGPLVLVGVVVLLLGALAGLRWARRRRHVRRGSAGAWAELVDLLVLLGRRPAVGESAPDIAAALDRRLPGSGASASAVAAAAERAVYAPVRETFADPRVWRDLRVLRRRAHRSLPWPRRLLLPVDPRPLLPGRRAQLRQRGSLKP